MMKGRLISLILPALALPSLSVTAQEVNPVREASGIRLTQDGPAVREEADTSAVQFEFIDSADTLATPEAPEVRLTRRQARKQAAETVFEDEYLDTVNVKKRSAINDYSMIGAQFGMGIGGALWNPTYKQKLRFSPYNVGIMFTRYGKMFGYMPFFGIQAGVFFGVEGYKFKTDKESGYTPKVQGATEAFMQVIEFPVLAHCHVDFWKMKMLINLGFFVGYRLNIERVSENPIEFQHEFTPTDHRFDYGLKGGVGFAFVFDPVEIHFQAMYKQSLSSLYDADYTSPYYYKFAYPMNIVFSVGLHFQITKRVGKTSAEIKQAAWDSINGVDPAKKDEVKKSVAWR